MFADPRIVAIVRATRERAYAQIPVECFNGWCDHPWCAPPRTNGAELPRREGDNDSPWRANAVRALEGD